MTTLDLNPFALIIDFWPELLVQTDCHSTLHSQVAWILYDKTNQQIIKRGHHSINLDTKNPESQVLASEFFLDDINKLLKNYYYPEVVVEDHQSLITLNKKTLIPNLQLEKTSHFSVVDDYQQKTELPISTLEEVLFNLGLTKNNLRLNSLEERTNKILDYYLESLARKEREQPYSRVPREIKGNSLSFWKIILHYFTGLVVTSCLSLGIYFLFNYQILVAVSYFLIATITSLFIFKHLRK